MIHDETPLLLAAGAVLDDLTPEELTAYEAHRATCAECRRVELELDHVIADLSLVVPERVPPPYLLGEIRRALAAEGAAQGSSAPTIPTPATLAPPVPSNVVPLRRASRGPVFASLALAAGLGVVALGLGARSLTLQQDVDAASAQVASLEQTLASVDDAMDDAMTVAMNAQHVTVALHAEPLAPSAEAAVVYIPGDTNSWIVARNLPATPAGHGYQLWYADDAGVHPLQTVSFDGTGVFAVPIGIDLADSAAVMITLEQDGGATGEPGPQVIFGEL
ncbi:MAG TPA: anti-sigma factor [Candidatus Limnocylindrales bacterium]|nr:anti-sigma factor [Candidatus Limnocylindrales bacterium]